MHYKRLLKKGLCITLTVGLLASNSLAVSAAQETGRIYSAVRSVGSLQAVGEDGQGKPESEPAGPETSGTREPSPDTPETLEPMPGIPEVPEPTPDTPQTPEPTPDTPQTPEPTPDTPEIPEPTPDTPDTPEPTPDTPETPEPTPDTPDTPEPTPDTPETPEPTPEPSKPPEAEAPDDQKPGTEDEMEPAEIPEDAKGEYSTNQELVQNQTIIQAPTVQEDFRFVTVEKQPCVSRESISVFEEMDEGARSVGKMSEGDICYLIEEEGEWLYIESGVVRGFVKAQSLYLDDEAQKLISQKENKYLSYQMELDALYAEQEKDVGTDAEKKADEKAAEDVGTGEGLPASGMDTAFSEPAEEPEKEGAYGKVSYSIDIQALFQTEKDLQESREMESKKETREQPDEPFSQQPDAEEEEQKTEEERKAEEERLLSELRANTATYAIAEVEPIQNQALAYVRKTTQQTVIDKAYAVAKESVTIYAGKSKKEQAAGTLAEGGLCYVLADEKEDYIFVESGDVRGFVQREQLLLGEGAKQQVESTGEESMETASESMGVKENPVLYYTLSSIKEGKISSAIRESVVNFARQFVGNPYVWGGTSLTNGADCSGFVQTIFNGYYGYALPRVAEDQAHYGEKIRVEDALPGDLIFYAKDGYIYHVVMYAGDGKTIEAQSTKTGIVEADVNTANAVWATRFIDDSDTEIIEAVNQKAMEQKASIEQTKASEDQIGEFLGNFKLTAYCNCSLCCGQWAGGPTASGTEPTQGRTVAMGGIPFGTRLVINGQIYTVEDRGTPYGHIDIYINSHEECNQFGVQHADVYMAK